MFLLSTLYLIIGISAIIIESDHIDTNLPCLDKSLEISKLYNSITECSDFQKDNIFICSHKTGKIISSLLKNNHCLDSTFQFILIQISYEIEEEPLCFSNFLFSNYMSKLSKDSIKNTRLYPKYFKDYNVWKTEMQVLNQICQNRSFIAAKNFYEILNRLWPMIDMPKPALVLIEYFENYIINKGIAYNKDIYYKKEGDYDDGGNMNFDDIKSLKINYDENERDMHEKRDMNYKEQIKDLKNEIGRNVRAIYELKTEVREILAEFRDFRLIYVMEYEKSKDFNNFAEQNQKLFTNDQKGESKDNRKTSENIFTSEKNLNSKSANVLFDILGINKNIQNELKDKILEDDFEYKQNNKDQTNFWEVFNELEREFSKTHQDKETSPIKSQDSEDNFHIQNDIKDEEISDINIENWTEELEKNNNTESEDYKSWAKSSEKMKMLIEFIQSTNLFNCAIERILLKVPLNILSKYLPSSLLKKLKFFLNAKKMITNSECSEFQKMFVDMIIFLIENEQFGVYNIIINIASKGFENISPEQIIEIIIFLYSNKELIKSADFSQWINDASIFIKDLKNPLLENAEMYYNNLKKNIGPHLKNYAENAGEQFNIYAKKAGVKFDELKVQAGEQIEVLKEQAGVKMEVLKEKAGVKFDELKEQAGVKFDEFKEQAGVKIGEIREEAGIKMGELKEKAGEKIVEIKEKAGEKIDEFKEKIEVKVGGYNEKAGEYINEIKSKAEVYWSDLKMKFKSWYL
ncbi:hypothetical protein SteCoe_26533 [Stentor coeruleus]|uniref:Uncharacterized protein n=1 Tax=Stentor coeruleus TaxID=5963 RepID=A0A1R2BCM5_9CILI|nr:hypothetical protein SteCoe_26533 [Stentor coeruleus]